VGRVAYGVPHGLDRLAGLGNALVPQIAEWIGTQIVSFEERSPLPPRRENANHVSVTKKGTNLD
jgi:hypothetical protein